MSFYKKILSCITIAAMLPFFCCYDTYASESSDTPNVAIDVFCPTDYPFLLFDNQSGGRQLTSQIFHIANYSDEDVVVDLSEARIEPGEGIPYKELSQPVDSSYASDSKDVFAFLKVVKIDSDKPLTQDSLKEIDIPMEEAVPQKDDFILTGTEKRSSYQIVLKGATHDEKGNFVSFNTDSIFSFYIAGSATPNKNLTWNHKDIQFHINIKFHTLLKTEELLPEETSLDVSTDYDAVSGISQTDLQDFSIPVQGNADESLPPAQDNGEGVADDSNMFAP